MRPPPVTVPEALLQMTELRPGGSYSERVSEGVDRASISPPISGVAGEGDTVGFPTVVGPTMEFEDGEFADACETSNCASGST